MRISRRCPCLRVDKFANQGLCPQFSAPVVLHDTFPSSCCGSFSTGRNAFPAMASLIQWSTDACHAWLVLMGIRTPNAHKTCTPHRDNSARNIQELCAPRCQPVCSLVVAHAAQQLPATGVSLAAADSSIWNALLLAALPALLRLLVLLLRGLPSTAVGRLVAPPLRLGGLQRLLQLARCLRTRMNLHVQKCRSLPASPAAMCSLCMTGRRIWNAAPEHSTDNCDPDTGTSMDRVQPPHT